MLREAGLFQGSPALAKASGSQERQGGGRASGPEGIMCAGTPAERECQSRAGAGWQRPPEVLELCKAQPGQ